MANLNLSEFTEKLFVADSDHTFIWDTAASISKRVSRNSWLNSGTLTSDAPVTISQTWGTTGTYTAVKVVATETLGANANSNLLELWAGNAATLKLFVKKNGDLAIRDQGQIGTPNFLLGSGSGSGIYFAGGDLRLYVDPVSAKFVMSNAQTAIKIGANYSFGWSNGADAALTADTILVRDSASGNTLALRNGTSAQTFNVYGTYSTSPSLAYSRLAISCDTSGNATLITQSTGAAGNLQITGQNELRLGVGASWQWRVNSSGHFQAGTDNTYDIGASTGNRPKDIFLTGTLYSNTIRDSTTGVLSFVTTGSTRMTITGAGNVGIGTTSPTSKLQVSAGDVEVDTIAKGVILKSPDGTRYRVTVANGGTLSVAAV